jgi:hypothetical protein
LLKRPFDFGPMQDESQRPARIAGLEGLELRGRTSHRRSGEALGLIGWIGFLPDGRALRLLAVAPADDFDDTLPAFEALARSLRLR